METYSGKTTEEYLEFYKDNPQEVLIEVTSPCNLKCVGCPQSLEEYQKAKWSPAFMDFELYEKILRETKEAFRPINVGLYHTGEITMLPPKAFDKYTKMAKGVLTDAEGWTSVGFYTNGLKMDLEKRWSIINNGINWVRLSFDGGTKEAYEKVRVGSNFEQVYGNALSLAMMARDHRPDMRLEVIFVPYKENEDSIREFHDLWRDSGWKASTGGASNYGGMTEHLVENRMHKFQGRIRGRHSIPCPRVFEQFTILVDGKVSLCSFDPMGKKVLGDMKTQTVKEVWESALRAEVLKEHLDYGGRNIEPCKGCSYTEYCGTPFGDYFGEKRVS